MKIKKVAQTPGVLATVSTSKIDSDKDTYSCNYLNDNAVVVSPTEPSDGKVWLQKGKNLYDKPNEIGRISTSDGGNRDDAAWVRTADYIEVKPNTRYTNTVFPSFNQMVIFYYNNTKFVSKEIKQLSNYGTFTTPSDCNQVRFSFDRSTATQCVLLKGEEEATSYELYTPKKIHTKNDNGVYEEFYNEENREVYSTGETRIGTWLGKPLYRKVYSIDKFPNNTTLEVLSGLTDIKVKNIYGYCENSTQMFPLNNANPTGVEYQVQLWYVYSGASGKNRIFIQTVRDRSEYSGCVVLEYTKTTE